MMRSHTFFGAGLKIPALARGLEQEQEQQAEEAISTSTATTSGDASDGDDGDDGDDGGDGGSTATAIADAGASTAEQEEEGEEEEDEDTQHRALVIPELLLQVLGRVDPATLVRGAPRVCRAWRCAALDRSLWQPLLDAAVLAAVEGEEQQQQQQEDGDGEARQQQRSCSSFAVGRPRRRKAPRAAEAAAGAAASSAPEAMLPRLYFGLYRRNLIRNPRFVHGLNGGSGASEGTGWRAWRPSSGGGRSGSGGGGGGGGGPSPRHPRQQQQQQQQQQRGGASMPPAWTISNGMQPTWECPPRGLSPYVFPPPPPLPHPSSCGGGGGLAEGDSGGDNSGAGDDGGGFFHRLLMQLMGSGSSSSLVSNNTPCSPRSWHLGSGGGGGGGGDAGKSSEGAPPAALELPCPRPSPSPSPAPRRLPAAPSPVPCLAAPPSAWCEVAQVVDLREELLRRVPGLTPAGAERLLDSGLALGLAVWVAAPEEAGCAAPAAAAAAASAADGAARAFASGPCPFALCLRLDEGAGPCAGAPPTSTNPFASPPDALPPHLRDQGVVAAAAAEPGRSPPDFTSFGAFVRRPSAHHYYSRRLAAVAGQWRRFAYAVQVPAGCRRAVVLLRGRGPSPAGGGVLGGMGGAGPVGGGAGGAGGAAASGVKFASAQLSFLPAGEVAAFGADECIASWEQRRLF